MTPDDNLVTITFPAAISSTSKVGNDPVYRSTKLTQPINLIDTGQALLIASKKIPAFWGEDGND